MNFAALVLAIVTQVKPAELIRFVPDSARNLMLLNLDGVTLFPFDKLIEPLDDVLPFDARVLVRGIRPLKSGAISIGAGGDEGLAKLALVHMDEDWSQTIVLYAPGGTTDRARKTPQMLSGRRFEEPPIGWGTLVLDDHTFALVRGKDAPALARAVKDRKVGRPRALTRPFSPVEDLIAEVRSTPARGGSLLGGENIDAATIVIRGSRDGALTLALTLRCTRGKGRHVATRIRAAGSAAGGRIAEVYQSGSIEESSDLVRASYSIPAGLASAIIFSK